ncbi:hypothetical protein MP228_008539 [Amoeboaphelidium protococcarum]|nr:hypothetical protein MP228_008539 [Amoeboaphelidium protococcarum]
MVKRKPAGLARTAVEEQKVKATELEQAVVIPGKTDDDQITVDDIAQLLNTAAQHESEGNQEQQELCIRAAVIESRKLYDADSDNSQVVYVCAKSLFAFAQYLRHNEDHDEHEQSEEYLMLVQDILDDLDEEKRDQDYFVLKCLTDFIIDDGAGDDTMTLLTHLVDLPNIKADQNLISLCGFAIIVFDCSFESDGIELIAKIVEKGLEGAEPEQKPQMELLRVQSQLAKLQLVVMGDDDAEEEVSMLQSLLQTWEEIFLKYPSIKQEMLTTKFDILLVKLELYEDEFESIVEEIKQVYDQIEDPSEDLQASMDDILEEYEGDWGSSDFSDGDEDEEVEDEDEEDEE